MDTLNIVGLSVNTHIGVHDWEQRILQTLVLNISIITDFKNCNDELANTIDYDHLCQAITEYLESNAFKLIETVAENVASLVKSLCGDKEVTVSVNKPHAIKNAKEVRVSITR